MGTVTFPNIDPLSFEVKTNLNAADLNANFDVLIPALNPQGTTGGMDGSNIATAHRSFLPFQFKEPYGRFNTAARAGDSYGGGGNVSDQVRWAGAVSVTNPTFKVLDAITLPENCVLTRVGCYLQSVVGFTAGEFPCNLYVIQNQTPVVDDNPNSARQFKLLPASVATLPINLVTADQRLTLDVTVPCNAGDTLYLVVEPSIYPAINPSALYLQWHLSFKTLQGQG